MRSWWIRFHYFATAVCAWEPVIKSKLFINKIKTCNSLTRQVSLASIKTEAVWSTALSFVWKLCIVRGHHGFPLELASVILDIRIRFCLFKIQSVGKFCCFCQRSRPVQVWFCFLRRWNLPKYWLNLVPVSAWKPKINLGFGGKNRLLWAEAYNSRLVSEKSACTVFDNEKDHFFLGLPIAASASLLKNFQKFQTCALKKDGLIVLFIRTYLSLDLYSWWRWEVKCEGVSEVSVALYPGIALFYSAKYFTFAIQESEELLSLTIAICSKMKRGTKIPSQSTSKNMVSKISSRDSICIWSSTSSYLLSVVLEIKVRAIIFTFLVFHSHWSWFAIQTEKQNPQSCMRIWLQIYTCCCMFQTKTQFLALGDLRPYQNSTIWEHQHLASVEK